VEEDFLQVSLSFLNRNGGQDDVCGLYAMWLVMSQALSVVALFALRRRLSVFVSAKDNTLSSGLFVVCRSLLALGLLACITKELVLSSSQVTDATRRICSDRFPFWERITAPPPAGSASSPCLDSFPVSHPSCMCSCIPFPDCVVESNENTDVPPPSFSATDVGFLGFFQRSVKSFFAALGLSHEMDGRSAMFPSEGILWVGLSFIGAVFGLLVWGLFFLCARGKLAFSCVNQTPALAPTRTAVAAAHAQPSPFQLEDHVGTTTQRWNERTFWDLGTATGLVSFLWLVVYIGLFPDSPFSRSVVSYLGIISCLVLVSYVVTVAWYTMKCVSWLLVFLLLSPTVLRARGQGGRRLSRKETRCERHMKEILFLLAFSCFSPSEGVLLMLSPLDPLAADPSRPLRKAPLCAGYDKRVVLPPRDSRWWTLYADCLPPNLRDAFRSVAAASLETFPLKELSRFFSSCTPSGQAEDVSRLRKTRQTETGGAPSSKRRASGKEDKEARNKFFWVSMPIKELLSAVLVSLSYLPSPHRVLVSVIQNVAESFPLSFPLILNSALQQTNAVFFSPSVVEYGLLAVGCGWYMGQGVTYLASAITALVL